MCSHRGPGPFGTLCCDNARPHDEDGERNHTYTATGLPDAHDASESAAEAAR